MARLFGTDGIRGVANHFPMTPEMMVKIGMAVGESLLKTNQGVVIGRDSRISGQMLEYALSSGIVASGIDVLLAGMLPTPAVAFLTRQLPVQAGIVISASHNPAQDNGVKIFSHDGFKLPDELEASIEKQVLDEQIPQKRPTGVDIGRIRNLPEAAEQYANYLVNSIFSEDIPDFRGIKVVMDCANGAASFIAPSILKSLQMTVVELSVNPDGLNINRDCGTLHTTALQKCVRREHADLGIAFDGDADRLILIDEHGEHVDGDRILAMLALDLFRKHQLKNNVVVATVMSNLGLEIVMKELGLTFVRTAVGDRYVVQKMREIGANLGGEQSGHVVMFDHGTTGDGLATTLAILKLLQGSGQPLSHLASCMKTFPQTLVNIPVKERKPIEEMMGVSEAIRRAEKELGDRGRTLVRYSGTELLARVMVEAEDEAMVTRIADMIVEEFHKEHR